MSGGIEQLVARGAQDVFLTGDPQVSFFRSAYKRHTNFSQVRHRQVIQGNPANGGMSTVRFERKGDMLSYTYLVRKIGNTVQQTIYDAVDYVELYIGGQLIDTQDNTFTSRVFPDAMAKNTAQSYLGTAGSSEIYPLRFFFCNNYTNALPLVGLQYHDVEIRIYWKDTAAITTDTFECWSNFIYLDTDEREFFASTPQNMLIRQVQSLKVPADKRIELNFNHPVSFIANADATPTGGTGRDVKVLLKINGSDVGEAMEITPHYNLAPTLYHVPFPAGTSSSAVNFIIPFSVNTGEEQPSGALNFSRLDSARLISESNFVNTGFGEKIYAVNFNVLKIENGMGGLLFSN